MKRNRIVPFVMAFIMLLSVAFSILFIAEEADHICSNQDCRICYQINCCLDLLNTFSPAPSAVLTAAVLIFTVVLTIGAVRINRNINTLISLKVKLSN